MSTSALYLSESQATPDKARKFCNLRLLAERLTAVKKLAFSEGPKKHLSKLVKLRAARKLIYDGRTAT